MVRRYVFIFVLLLIPLFLSDCACEESFCFFVSCDGEFSPDAISLTKAGGKYYLFLPGQVSLDNYRIGFSGAKDGEVFINGTLVSPGLSAGFLQSENDLKYGYNEIHFSVMQGSPELPVLYITTETGGLEKIHGNKKYQEPGYLVMTDKHGKIIYNGALTHIKMRGNASTKYPKKNYQIRLEKGRDLLGMGKARKWILSGNWLDKSFIRNELSYDLADYMDLPFTPQHQQAELYVNHQYLGLYLFSEKVEINEGRILITDLEEATENLNNKPLSDCRKIVRKLKNGVKIKAYDIQVIPDDITGGYLIEYESIRDRYDAEPSGFITKHEIGIVIKSPEYVSVSQASYIASIMQGFENAVFSENGVDPESGKRYDEFIDKNSLVRKYLLNEFIKNYDGNSSSEFFFKPEDRISELVYAGPVWDLDNSYADYAREYNAKYLSTPEGFYISNASANTNWWPNLCAIQDFHDSVVQYFNGNFRTAIEIILGRLPSVSGKLKSLNDYQKAIEESAEMNYVLYPYMKAERGVIQTGDTFQENMDYLRLYITERMDFLDREWIENDDRLKDLLFLVRQTD